MAVNIDATFELPHSCEATRELQEWRENRICEKFSL